MTDPLMPSGEPPAAVIITPGAIISWILGALITLGSLVFFVINATATCSTVVCTLNSTMAMSAAAFGIFFGLTFIVLGLWAVRKAAFRAEAEARRAAQMRSELENL